MLHRPRISRQGWLRVGGAVAAATALLTVPTFVGAQTYPDKPVRIVVGFAPGGTNDILARLVAAKLQVRMQQAFVVDNKPGANSAIGTDFVAKSKPDGYTLLVSSSGGLTVNPVLMKGLGYDSVKDFDPIALLGTFPLVVTTPANLPVKNIAQLVQYGKTLPGGMLNHGVASSSFQLTAESLAHSTGMKFNQISYRGSGPVVVALLGGEVQVATLDSAAVMTQVKAGKLKALAVTTGKRSAAYPDIPTVAESGVPGYDVTIWTALMAPKGTPEPIRQQLKAAVQAVLEDKEMVQKMHQLGMDPGNTDAPALARRVASDIERWTELAAIANIQAQ